MQLQLPQRSRSEATWYSHCTIVQAVRMVDHAVVLQCCWFQGGIEDSTAAWMLFQWINDDPVVISACTLTLQAGSQWQFSRHLEMSEVADR